MSESLICETRLHEYSCKRVFAFASWKSGIISQVCGIIRLLCSSPDITLGSKESLMAMSKCPKCESNQFEIVSAKNVKGLSYPLMFLQCALCGAVTGVLEESNITTLIHALAAKLRVDL